MIRRSDRMEQQEIKDMLHEIESTPSGAEAVKNLRRLGYRIRYGRPLGGGAFTYPWRVITLRRGHSYRATRSMLIHEVGHTAFSLPKRAPWAASVQQEYEANRFWAQVSRELGALPRHRENVWFGAEHDVGLLYDEIRHASPWHRVALPEQQPQGLRGVIWAAWQAIASLVWVFRR